MKPGKVWGNSGDDKAAVLGRENWAAVGEAVAGGTGGGGADDAVGDNLAEFGLRHGELHPDGAGLVAPRQGHIVDGQELMAPRPIKLKAHAEHGTPFPPKLSGQD